MDGPRRSPRRPSPGSAEEPRPKIRRQDEPHASRRRLSTGPAEEDPFNKEVSALMGAVATGQERQRAHMAIEEARNEEQQAQQMAVLQEVLRELQKSNGPRAGC